MYVLLTGKDVSDRWYNEVNQYNFNQPGFSSATGKTALPLWEIKLPVKFSSGSYQTHLNQQLKVFLCSYATLHFI